MSLRKFIAKNQISKVDKEISRRYEIASVIKACEPIPVIFERVKESDFRVFGNLLCTKTAFADYLNIETSKIIPTLSHAIEARTPPEEVTEAPCQEVILSPPNLDKLPILKHFESDGGNYITAGVFIAKHPEYGQNADFHRCMQLSQNEMSVRVVRSRNFDTFLQDVKELDVAICIGNSPNVLVAAAISVEIGINELEIANALEPLKVVQAKTVDVLIPAESEFVIEGTVYLNRKNQEGPFVDLTETYDVIRQEPTLKVKAITHRKDPLWHALLPGGLEHKLLMGMPREPTIFQKVNLVVKCLDVNVNPGGCSWLHAVVQIDKRDEEDGKKAIAAAFEGHSSCKHVFVVDEDIDIYNPLEVEWAMATRFQGDVDMVVMDKMPGSSLDPSAEPGTKMTTKIGFDLTKPLGKDSANYKKAPFPKVDIKKFLDE
jgi:2,5-furandicarboxylate decarboxylase 1